MSGEATTAGGSSRSGGLSDPIRPDNLGDLRVEVYYVLRHDHFQRFLSQEGMGGMGREGVFQRAGWDGWHGTG